MAHNTSHGPKTQKVRKVGMRLAAMVGGFLLLIMVIGWLYLAAH